MATIKLVLRTNKMRGDGMAPLYLRITVNRKSRFLSSGIFIEPQYWNNKKQVVRKGHPLSSAYNARLADLRIQVERSILETERKSGSVSAENLKRQIVGGDSVFSQYLDRFIDDLDEQKRFWSWKRYRVLRQKLEACLGKNIRWEELNRGALEKLERFMHDKLGNGPNTIRKEFAMLHRVIRQAVKDGEITADQDPFIHFEPPKPKQPRRIKLAPGEIESLMKIELTPGSWAALARDAWLISFYLGGMRFGDLACLKVENFQNTSEGWRCVYRMNKTGRCISIPVPEQAIRLLAPYMKGKQPQDFVMPFLNRGDDEDPRKLRRRISSKNTMCNKNIKVAAKRAGIADPSSVSMHISRHSFADYARKKSGNLYAISKTLGHSSLQITETYLKSFDQEAVDQLGKELWDK